MMRDRCDLHVHSTFSDGTWTPAQLVAEAKALNLGALALTDHNTVAGLPDFLAAAEAAGVEAVPGVELTTEYRGKELHILALFLRPEHYPSIEGLVAEMMTHKDKANRDLVRSLDQAGIRLDYVAVCASASDGCPNRAVIAAEMVRLGYCASIKECFSRWLDPKHGHYVPPRRLDALQTIRFIRDLGAVSVLAHPYLSLEAHELEEFLPQATAHGLHAIETRYSTFTPEQTGQLSRLAIRFEILESGGSDFHGGNKPDIRLGSGRGELVVPLDFFGKIAKL